jgi:hypothetical protein
VQQAGLHRAPDDGGVRAHLGVVTTATAFAPVKHLWPPQGSEAATKWFWRRGAMRRSSRIGYSQRDLNAS